MNGYDARFVIQGNVIRNFTKRNLLPIDDTGCDTVQRLTMLLGAVSSAGQSVGLTYRRSLVQVQYRPVKKLGGLNEI